MKIPISKLNNAKKMLAVSAMLVAASARAGLPEPGARIYGTVALNGVIVTASDTTVVVEARKTPLGSPIASYRMGSQAAAGNFYSLKVNAEAAAPLSDANNVIFGDSIFIVVRNATSDLNQTTFVVSERGMTARVDFGAVDTDGDGMSDAFELKYFGSITGGDPNADPDHDGRPNFREFLQGTDPNAPDGRHPADISPADDRISLEEVTAYILAWKTGASWPVEPPLNAPNIEDYVTRAGAIWKGGEAYIFDNDPPTVAPLWWTNPPTANLADVKKAAAAAAPLAQLAVTRLLASAYKPNLAVPVSISVTPTSNTKAYAVVEAPPLGWTVRNLSNDGRWDEKNHKIKWGPFFDENPRTLTYDAVPGPTSIGPADFAGRGSFDGIGKVADGPLRMWPAGLTPPAQLAFVPSDAGLNVELRGEAGRHYEVQSSEDLLNWAPGDTVTLNANGRATLPLDGSGQVQFLRLRAVE